MPKKPAKRVSKAHVKGWITRKKRLAEAEREKAKRAKVRKPKKSAKRPAKKPAKRPVKRPAKKSLAQATKTARNLVTKPVDLSEVRKPWKKRKPGKRAPKGKRQRPFTREQLAVIPEILASKRTPKGKASAKNFVVDKYWTKEDGSIGAFPSWARNHPQRDDYYRAMVKADKQGRLSMIVRMLARLSGIEVKELYTLYYSP